MNTTKAIILDDKTFDNIDLAFLHGCTIVELFEERSTVDLSRHVTPDVSRYVTEWKPIVQRPAGEGNAGEGNRSTDTDADIGLPASPRYPNGVSLSSIGEVGPLGLPEIPQPTDASPPSHPAPPSTGTPSPQVEGRVAETTIVCRACEGGGVHTGVRCSRCAGFGYELIPVDKVEP